MSNNKENQQFNSQLFNTRKFACRVLSTSRGSVQTGSLQNDCSLKVFTESFIALAKFQYFSDIENLKVREFTIWVCPKIGVKPPKWMVKILEKPIQLDDLGGKTHFLVQHPY